MAYITKQNVKHYLGVNFVAGLDAFVDLVIAQVQAYIEKECGDERFGKRVFEVTGDDTATVRYFDGNDDTKIDVGDLREITSLSVGGTALTQDQDYFLYPLNAPELGEPYRWIELIQPETRLNMNPRLINSSPYIFEQGQKKIAVTGKWGYSVEPPPEIKLAAMKLVGGVLKENIGDGDIREIKSETLGDYKADYETIDKIAHSLKVADLLTPYKRNKGIGFSGTSRI